MHARMRLLARAILIVAGLGIALFFALLLAIADCGSGCIERGERVPAYLAIAAGLGFVTTGIALGGPARRALAIGALSAGIVAIAGAAVTWRDGARAWPVWALGIAGLALAIGGARGMRPR